MIARKEFSLTHFRVNKTISEKEFTPSFNPEFFRIQYPSNNHNNAAVDCGLQLQYFATKTKEIMIDIGSIGVFRINKETNINEVDLYGCLLILWEEMKAVIELDLKTKVPFHFGDTKELHGFLYDILVKSYQQ